MSEKIPLIKRKKSYVITYRGDKIIKDNNYVKHKTRSTLIANKKLYQLYNNYYKQQTDDENIDVLT